MVLRLWSTALVASLVAAPETITFRSEVNLRSVPVRVTDARGRMITGLGQNSFELLENGTRQRIAFLQSQGEPLSIAVLVDTSSSMRNGRKLQEARYALRQLTSALNSASEVFYSEFGNKSGDLIPVSAADSWFPEPGATRGSEQSGTAVYDAIAVALCRLKNSRFPHRAMVVITDGADQHSRLRLQELIGYLQATDTQVYIIGAFSREEYDLYQTGGDSVNLVTGRSIDNPLRAFQRLARESAAESYFPITTAQLRRSTEALKRDLDSYYTLGYYMRPNDSPTRRVEVKLLDPRYRVKFRQEFSNESEFVHFQEQTCDISPSDHPYPYERKLLNRGGSMVYREDFGDVRSGWPSRETSWYGDHEYHLTGSSGGTIVAYGPSWNDFRASVEFRASPVPATISGPGVQSLPAAGLIFRVGERGYYAAVVTKAGDKLRAKLALNRFDGTSRDLLTWTETEPLGDPGSNGWSRLTVGCRGAEIYVQVNGRELGHISDATFRFGHVGMAQFGSGHTVFRNLSVAASKQDTLRP